MSKSLNGKQIAFLVANTGVEQVELTAPSPRPSSTRSADDVRPVACGGFAFAIAE